MQKRLSQARHYVVRDLSLSFNEQLIMSNTAHGEGRPTQNIILYVTLLVALYSLCVSGLFKYASFHDMATPSMDSIVDVCKIVSLLSLTYIGGELAYHREQLDSVSFLRGSWFIKAFIRLIIPICVVALIVLLVKLAAGPFQLFGDVKLLPKPGQQIIYFSKLYGPFLAMLPIFAYAAVNAIIALSSHRAFKKIPLESKSKFYKNKQRCTQFFIFSNFTVIIPLSGVVVILSVTGNMFVEGPRDLFLSGALAVILFVSSVSAKAVEEYATVEAI